MAESSGFFPSINGDRKYLTNFFAEYFADFISNGIYPNPSTQCQVLANNNMSVKVKPGNAYINGYKYKNDSDLVLNIDTADGVLSRIDRIVLRHTVLNREIKAYVKKGAFSSTPVALNLQRDADIWELGLADIYIANGAVSISQANITDLRLNNLYCGIVHGVIEQVDTTTLFNQYQAWLADAVDEATTEIAMTLSAFQNSFNTWFANLQTTLSGDVAGNLFNLITTNTDKISTGVIGTTWTGSSVPYTQTISNANVTANNIIEIGLASTATDAQTKAWDALNLKDGGQTAGSFTVKCWNYKNTIEIPIVITVRGE